MVKARKRFGQHFLTDAAVLQAITDAVAARPDQPLVEIGPGRGALTEYLYAGREQMHAIELDRDLVPFLRARFTNLNVVSADVLSDAFDDLLSADSAWRIVGNLPYNITSPLLVKLAGMTRSTPGLIQDGHFMVQKEVAARLAASPGTKAWGRLSVVLKLHFETEVLFDVAPECFTPPPKVWSSVIRMVQVSDGLQLDENAYTILDDVLKRAFSARRKRLANALKNYQLNWSAVSVDPDLRADQIDVDGYVELAQHLAAIT